MDRILKMKLFLIKRNKMRSLLQLLVVGRGAFGTPWAYCGFSVLVQIINCCFSLASPRCVPKSWSFWVRTRWITTTGRSLSSARTVSTGFSLQNRRPKLWKANTTLTIQVRKMIEPWMKMLSSFTHPHVVWFWCPYNTKSIEGQQNKFGATCESAFNAL